MFECVRIGRATLYRDDCRFVLPHLPPCDLVLVDPPYGLGFPMQPTTGQRKRNQPRDTWDNETMHDLPWLLEQSRAPVQIVWGGNYYSLPPSRGWLCWYKPDAPPSMGHFELAWTNQDMLPRLFQHSISATNPERVAHPTQKPVALMSKCIDVLANKPQTVLDFCMGSGSTGVAAVRMGLSFIGIEKNPEYFALACKRIEDAQRQVDMFVAPPIHESLPLPLINLAEQG